MQQLEKVNHEITLFAEPIFHFDHFYITNALITTWFAVLFIIIFVFFLRRKLSEIPGKMQSIFEIIIENAMNLCDQITGKREVSKKVFPIAITVFLFILINNWFGILPLGGFGILEKGEHGTTFIPFLRGGTADVNLTIALAIASVIGANIFGIFSIGIWKVFNKYVNIGTLWQISKARKSPAVLITSPITFFVGLIEIAGELAKVASLSFRLFGNVFAGEVLLISMAALAPYIVPIPFLVLEIFVGFIQALIFSILLIVYFTIAASSHEH